MHGALLPIFKKFAIKNFQKKATKIKFEVLRYFFLCKKVYKKDQINRDVFPGA
jgi:hypothetical protein